MGLLVAAMIILSNDERIVIARPLRKWLFPAGGFAVFFMMLFIFCMFNELLVAITGFVILIRRRPNWLGLFLLAAAAVFYFIVRVYVGDSW